MNLREVEDFWRAFFGVRWPAEDAFYGLIERFVAGVRMLDAPALAAVRGQPMIVLANHQVMLESLLASIVLGGWNRVPLVTIAKAEHRTTWLGRLIRHAFSHPGVRDPEVITFFDRSDAGGMAAILAGVAARMKAGTQSLLVHTDGTRATAAGAPIENVSGAFLDLAVATGRPIVPLRFLGGLPTTPVSERLDFPIGLGRQTLVLGRPISAETLRSLPLKARKQAVLDGFRALEAIPDVPEPPDVSLCRALDRPDGAFIGPDDAAAVMEAVLRGSPRASDALAAWLAAWRTGT